MNDVDLKEYLEAQIESLRREVSVQREADLLASKLARDVLSARIETFRWTVDTILGLAVAVAAVVTVYRHF